MLSNSPQAAMEPEGDFPIVTQRACIPIGCYAHASKNAAASPGCSPATPPISPAGRCASMVA
jgi:hypothetical protein